MNGDSDESEYVDDSDHKSAGRKSKAQTSKAKRGRSTNAAIKQETSRGSSVAPDDQPASKGTKDAAAQKVKSDTLRFYRDLLNSNIAEVLQPSEILGSNSLTPSQIGVSFWTFKEKHRLFAAIQSHGPGDLQTIAAAIGTKAEPEIKAYILLLQDGVRELDTRATTQFGPADVDAAIETGPELLEAEEALATIVEERARAVEENGEKQRWGEESWLIDEDVAAAIDGRYGSSDDRADEPRANSDDEQPDNGSPSSDELLKPSTSTRFVR